jgi:hypothetical protein
LGEDHKDGCERKEMRENRWGDWPLYVEKFRGRAGEENRGENVYVYLLYPDLFIKQ